MRRLLPLVIAILSVVAFIPALDGDFLTRDDVHSGLQPAHDRYSYLSGLGLASLAGGAISWILAAAGSGQVNRWVVTAALRVAAP